MTDTPPLLLPRFRLSAPNIFPPRLKLCCLLAAACLVQAARADDDGGPMAARIPLLPAYKTECSACHVAYPPALLPGAAWQRLMANLPRHFGTDASLDPVTAAPVATWLVANAATGTTARAAPPEDRITRSPWFIRQHDEVPPAAWKRPSVRSAANCSACHAQADQGDFNEHHVRIPR